MGRPKKFERIVLVDKAMFVFWKKGFDRTSVHDLTKALEIHPGSLYDVFKDKDALFAEIFDRYVEIIGLPMLDDISRPDANLGALQRFFRQQRDLLVSKKGYWGCLITNTMASLGTASPAIIRKAMQYQEMVQEIFQKVLRGAVTKKQLKLPPGLSVPDLAAYLNGSLQGMRVLARTRPEPREMDRIVRSITAVLKGMTDVG